MVSRFVALLLFAPLAFAQLETNSVTVTSSRVLNVQPDQVVFGVFLTSGLNTSLSDVLAVLQPLGISAANFTGVSSPGLLFGVISTTPPPTAPIPVPTLQWNFTLPVPFANLQATVTAVTRLQNTVALQNNGLSLAFSVQGTQVSAQLAQSQTCPLDELLSGAQAQAQRLANVAGRAVQGVIAISSVTVAATVGGGPCTMTVKFSLK